MRGPYEKVILISLAPGGLLDIQELKGDDQLVDISQMWKHNGGRCQKQENQLGICCLN